MVFGVELRGRDLVVRRVRDRKRGWIMDFDEVWMEGF